ncbi:MAG: thrombospondin type 3 repeat family protein [Alteromonadaceae bacterium]|nr:thrombospondin type 3 repeat family protein [Alteromonadaceae bacterium]
MRKGSFLRRLKPAFAIGLVLVGCSASGAWASHFRGGSITWQALELDSDGQVNDVEVTIKTAWALNGSNALSLNSPGLTFTQVGSDSIIDLGDSPEAAGKYTLRTAIFRAKDLDLTTSYPVNFSACCRISTLVNNSDDPWNIQTVINLQDGNLAPKVELPIIFEVPQIQQDDAVLADWSFNTGSTDPNADKLKFRLANVSEMGDPSATQPPGFSINPNTGTLSWTGSGTLAPGLYSAGIVAEDLDSTGVIKSKSHVDFILYLQNKKAVQFTTSANVPETRNVIVEKGTTFSFDVTGTAIETTSLGDVQGALSESAQTAGTFTFDPAALHPAAYPITFEVRDTTATATKSYLILNFIVPDPDAPRIANIEADRTIYGANVQQLVDKDLDAVVTDANNPDFNGGLLKFNVVFTDGQYEVLGVNSVGDGAGEIRRDGRDIYYEGNLIGLVDSREDGAGRALKISFTSGNATPAALTALVRSLTYEDTFTLRSDSDRNLSIYLRDADGKSNSYSLYTDVQAHPDRPLSGGPVEAANRLSIVEGTSYTLSTEELNYADPDTDPADIVLTPSSVVAGQFESISSPGIALVSFTQKEVDLGQVSFVHDGSVSAPSYDISASDGTTATTPKAADITFTGLTDTDGDGVPDHVETTDEGTDPNDPKDVKDTDGDGIPDYVEENQENTDPTDKIDYRDTDGDGVPDFVEVKEGTGPGDPKGYKDADGDGVPDYYEQNVDGTDPNDPKNVKDTDGDGVPDYYETKIDGTDPLSKSSVKDRDGDQVPDYIEIFVDGTDPEAAAEFKDSDNDGIPDYVELFVTDSTPPVVSAPPAVTLQGTGLYTKVTRAQLESLGIASASDGKDGGNCCSPYPKSLVDNEPFFPPGRHKIVWAAQDAAGNIGQASQILDIKPLVSLGKDQTLPEGATGSIRIILNGRAPEYPVRVPFTVSGSATHPEDHNLVSGEAVIESGLEVTVPIRLVADAVPEADETVVVKLGEGVNRGPNDRHSLTISERNIAPQVQLVVSQNDNERLTLLRDGGLFHVLAMVTDANTGDAHSYTWETDFLQDLDDDPSVVTIDPSSLELEKAYPVRLTVSDNGSPVLKKSVSVTLKVVDELKPLSADADSDGDGIADADEGYQDTDQDGIPDYLDSNANDCSVLPEQLSEQQRYLMESDAGTCLKLSNYSLFATHGGSSLAEQEDIAQNRQRSINPDTDVTNVGGIFDFSVDQLPDAGQSVHIVIPQRKAVPTNAVYRKFDTVRRWHDFTVNDSNRLSSAAGEPGFCPPAGSPLYTTGLSAGDWCVQLTIQDGGPNDADGEPNGTVVDPGGVGVIAGLDNEGTVKTSGGGGAMGFGSLLVLLGIGALGRKAARSQTGVGRSTLGLTLAGIFALTLAGQPTSVLADEDKPAPLYLTTSLGYAFTDISKGEMDARFAGAGYDAQTLSTEGDRFAWSIGGGYRFNDRFAFEVNFVDLGDVDVSFKSTPLDRALSDVHPESGHGPAVSLLYRHPVTERLGVNARLGMFFWEGDFNTSQDSVRIGDSSDKGQDVYYGIGLDYTYNREWSLLAEVQRFEFDRDPSYFPSVGVVFRFPEWLKK